MGTNVMHTCSLCSSALNSCTLNCLKKTFLLLSFIRDLYTLQDAMIVVRYSITSCSYMMAKQSCLVILAVVHW